MKAIPAVLCLLAALPLPAVATLYQGAFLSDDEVRIFAFNIPIAGLVTLRTTSYAAGGFDPVLTLFDATGNYVISNNDGPCAIVAHDPVTGNCFDAYLSIGLSAGAYQLALTESDNLAIGPSLADGFLQTGNGDFTCLEFLGQPGAFCDASPAQRSSAFALDIGTSPEPSTLLLLAAGIAVLAIHRTKGSLR